MNRTDEIIEQTFHLTRCGLSYSEIREVLKAARKLHAVSERQCNGYHEYEVSHGYDKRDENAEKKAETIILAALIRENVEFQGDPRGAPVIVRTAKNGEFRIWG